MQEPVSRISFMRTNEVFLCMSVTACVSQLCGRRGLPEGALYTSKAGNLAFIGCSRSAKK